MKGYTAVSDSGALVYYEDRKRWLWLLSVGFPLIVFPGLWLHATTGVEAWLLLPIPIVYIVTPLLDWWIGEDTNNPPEEVVRQLDNDHYYRVLTYAVVPLHIVAFLVTAWWAGTQPLSIWGFVGLGITAGMASGLAINTGHELGHKNSPLERLLAKIVLAVPAYGHFWIEHNRGHHMTVATPDDPASARMGESIYRFAMREMPGALRGAWAIEKERLERRGLRVWGRDNRILQSYALTAVLQLSMVVAFGPKMIGFLLLHNFFAWWQLTSANYIEHYGLLRPKDERGRYTRCEPQHSWNCNYVLTNLVMFHLERHSDHHAYPLRRYQSLRHFDDLPTLPNGYYGCFVLAWIPWLWFRIMDPKLLALPHVQGDLNKVNVQPDRRAMIEARYGSELVANP